jgi:hypothetical protein
LARAFLWEYSFERLKLVQLLGQLGIFLTCSQVVIILPLRCTSTPTLSSPIVPVHAYENNHDTLSDKPFYQLDSKHPSQLLKVSWWQMYSLAAGVCSSSRGAWARVTIGRA